jgi:hypothetical protein
MNRRSLRIGLGAFGLVAAAAAAFAGLWRSAAITGAISLALLLAAWALPGGAAQSPRGPTEESIRRAASRGKE